MMMMGIIHCKKVQVIIKAKFIYFLYFKLIIRFKNGLQSLLVIHKSILGWHGIKIWSYIEVTSQNKWLILKQQGFPMEVNILLGLIQSCISIYGQMVLLDLAIDKYTCLASQIKPVHLERVNKSFISLDKNQDKYNEFPRDTLSKIYKKDHAFLSYF